MIKRIALFLLCATCYLVSNAYYVSRVGSTYQSDLNPELPRESLPDIAHVNDQVTLQDLQAQPQVTLPGENRVPKYRRLR